MANGIRFIRKNGRVIPISDHGKSDIRNGAYTLASVGVASQVSRRLRVHSYNLSKSSLKSAGPRMTRSAAGFKTTAHLILRPTVLGFALGVGLLGIGVAKLAIHKLGSKRK